MLLRFRFIVLIALITPLAWAAIDTYQFETPEQEQRFAELTYELRCPKCQNTNIADSNAPLAADLRQKVHGMIVEGQGNQEIIDYMVARYGDFVTYRPPLKATTAILWFGPFIVMFTVAIILILWIRRRSRNRVSELSEQDRNRLDILLQKEQQ